MISVLIYLLILFLIAAVAWWILTLLPLPAPFLLVAQVAFAVILLIALISILLPFAHGGGIRLWQ